MANEKQNQIASFYAEHVPLINMLSDEQAGQLLKAVLSCVFEGSTASFDDPLLNGVYVATSAAALRQKSNYNKNNKISDKLEGNHNARKKKTTEEPNITVQ